MRFGLFGSAEAAGHARGGDRGQGFRDYVEYNVEAEALGYCSSFLVEHHFTGWSQVSATLQLLGWVAAQTTELRVGTAVIVLPWHNPVLLAEQAATLDALSGGRLDVGVGKGYRFTEFKGFGIPIEEADARFDEALELLIKSWTSIERFSFAGRFWRFDDIVVEPAPCQQPHPPLWMAAASRHSIARVAEYGCNLLLDQYASVEVLGERIALFRDELAHRGRALDSARIAVARDLYVAKNPADREAALQRHRRIQERTLAVSRDPHRLGGSHILRYDHTKYDAEQSMLYGSWGKSPRSSPRSRHSGSSTCFSISATHHATACALLPATSCQRSRDVARPRLSLANSWRCEPRRLLGIIGLGHVHRQSLDAQQPQHGAVDVAEARLWGGHDRRQRS